VADPDRPEPSDRTENCGQWRSKVKEPAFPSGGVGDSCSICDVRLGGVGTAPAGVPGLRSGERSSTQGDHQCSSRACSACPRPPSRPCSLSALSVPRRRKPSRHLRRRASRPPSPRMGPAATTSPRRGTPRPARRRTASHSPRAEPRSPRAP